MQNGLKPFRDRHPCAFQVLKASEMLFTKLQRQKCSVLNYTNNKNAWLKIIENNTNSNCKAVWPALLPFSGNGEEAHFMFGMKGCIKAGSSSTDDSFRPLSQLEGWTHRHPERLKSVGTQELASRPRRSRPCKVPDS